MYEKLVLCGRPIGRDNTGGDLLYFWQLLLEAGNWREERRLMMDSAHITFSHFFTSHSHYDTQSSHTSRIPATFSDLFEILFFPLLFSTLTV